MVMPTGNNLRKEANANFDSIHKYTQTNEWILNQIKADSSVSSSRNYRKWP
jgi:hypothetical protein